VAFDLKSTLVSVEAMARYLMAKEKLRKDLKLTTPEDHRSMTIEALDQTFVGVVNV
jgi:hypothetical protein